MVCTNNCTVYRVHSRHCRYYVKITRFFNDHVISSAYIECRTWTFLYMVAQYTQQFEPRLCVRVSLLCLCRLFLFTVICDMVNYVVDRDHFIMELCTFYGQTLIVCVLCFWYHMQTFALPLLFSVRLSLRELVYAAQCFFLVNVHCCVLIELRIDCGRLAIFSGINSWPFGTVKSFSSDCSVRSLRNIIKQWHSK